MLSTIFWVLIGMFVAWNFPQPDYARNFQDRMVAKWKEFRAKN